MLCARRLPSEGVSASVLSFFFNLCFFSVAGMGGRGKGLMTGGVTFQRGPITNSDSDTEMQTPDLEADRLSHLEEVRRRGNVSHRDRRTRDYVEQHGHEPWRRPRGRGRGIHDVAESSAGPSGPVNQYQPPYHQSPHQQEQHQSPFHRSPVVEMQPEGPLLTDFDSHICREILADPVIFLTRC